MGTFIWALRIYSNNSIINYQQNNLPLSPPKKQNPKKLIRGLPRKTCLAAIAEVNRAPRHKPKKKSIHKSESVPSKQHR